METTNSFLASYKEQLDSFSLPVRLADAYQLCDCLKKSTHKEIYVLTDAKETQFVLKRGTGNQLPLLKQEYQISQKLGSYEHYADALYSNIYNYLTPSVINTESCLYIYATASGEKSRVEYQGALSNIMNNIRMTIDWVDEQENAALEQ